MPELRYAVLLLVATAGCVPRGGALSGELPAPGVYPGHRSTSVNGPRTARDDRWIPAGEFSATLDLPGSLAAVVGAVPPTGSPVAVRTFAWPAPVEVREFGPEGIHLRGAPVPASRLAGEIRCLGLPAASPIALSARIVQGPRAVRVESRVETPSMVTCDLSWSGRKRLEAVATDVWMWGRELAARGSPIPAAP